MDAPRPSPTERPFANVDKPRRAVVLNEIARLATEYHVHTDCVCWILQPIDLSTKQAKRLVNAASGVTVSADLNS
jgi:hypothetical protein